MSEKKQSVKGSISYKELTGHINMNGMPLYQKKKKKPQWFSDATVSLCQEKPDNSKLVLNSGKVFSFYLKEPLESQILTQPPTLPLKLSFSGMRV